MLPLPDAVVHVFVLGLAGAAVVAACRFIYQRSHVCGVIVSGGLLLRLVSGATLFSLSYFDSSLLAGAHSGGGFWNLAPDARVYYGLASDAAARGISSIPPGSPSPFYLGLLGLWLAASGTSVLNAIFFNALCYVTSCLVLVIGIRPLYSRTSDWPGAPLLLALLTLTFSPILVMTSTQVLKDPLFSLLIVVAVVSALRILEALSRSSAPLAGWTAALVAAQLGIAGIRTYYAVFIWMSLAAAALCLIWRLPASHRLRGLTAAAALLCVLWAALIVGAGPYYAYYANLLRNTTGLRIPYITVVAPMPATGFVGEPDFGAIGGSVVNLRRGFVRAGGATNLSSAEQETAATPIEIIERAGLGLLAMFVPMTLLESAAIVDLQGGRGFLFVTDIDTLFMTVSLLVAVALIVRRRDAWRDQAPALLFGLILAVTCVLLMSYVITNFGTLFRLRLIGVAPVWLVPLAVVACRKESPRQCAA
jgi:hypothetical protein